MTLPARVEAKLFPVTESGCWLWTGAVLPNGYGVLTYQKQRKYAHRLVYELLRAPIPEGLQLDHLCRVRCCANPDHLEPVTLQENLRRGDVNQYVKATHCKRGHEFTVENTYQYKNKIGNPKRNCRACALAYSRMTYDKVRKAVR